MTILNPFGPLIYKETISQEFLSFLLEASEKTREANDWIGENLAGNIATQLNARCDPQGFCDHMYPYLVSYVHACKERWNQGTNTGVETAVQDVKYHLGDGPWLNFQKQYEFNPLHSHAGDLSAVIMIQIPHQIEDDRQASVGSTNMPCAGQLEFFHETAGYLYSGSHKIIPRTGDFYFFPASLKHTVYPFKSDVERITMSFNVFNVEIIGAKGFD